jgi:type I restriction enzyme M protein
LLRPSDLMRILVPWRAFGHLETTQRLVAEQECRLIEEEEAERARRLQDIEDAYAPLLEPLPTLKQELERLESVDFKAWIEKPDPAHPYFGPVLTLQEQIGRSLVTCGGEAAASRQGRDPARVLKVQLRTKTQEAKEAYKSRLKELVRTVKELEAIKQERDQKEAEVNGHADREIAHIREAAADLLRICLDPEEARRYFVVADRAEIEENEFNLNLPRYVDTFEPEEEIDLCTAIEQLEKAEQGSAQALADLRGRLTPGVASSK